MTAFFRFLTNAQYVVLKYELNQQSACKLIEQYMITFKETFKLSRLFENMHNEGMG